MTNLTIFTPMREMMTLREAMNQLFDDSFTGARPAAGAYILPAVDMYQTADEVVLKATLPGLKPEDIQISVTGEALTLRGEFKAREEKKEATYHVREQRQGAFERVLMLPTEVQTDKARADFENGILTITLPKAEAVKPKLIAIQAR